MQSIKEKTLNETIWIRKAQGGDADAFRNLVERHGSIIWSVINRMAPEPHLAEDLFQETVIRFWRGLPSFKGDSKLSTWLYRIVYRVYLDSLGESNQRETWVYLNDEMEITDDRIEDQEHSGVRIENDLAAREAVLQALARLHPEWRSMIILYYRREQSIEEISEITGRPVNTVKVYLHCARSFLGKVLEMKGFPQGS